MLCTCWDSEFQNKKTKNSLFSLWSNQYHTIRFTQFYFRVAAIWVKIELASYCVFLDSFFGLDSLRITGICLETLVFFGLWSTTCVTFPLHLDAVSVQWLDTRWAHVSSCCLTLALSYIPMPNEPCEWWKYVCLWVIGRFKKKRLRNQCFIPFAQLLPFNEREQMFIESLGCEWGWEPLHEWETVVFWVRHR